MTLIDARLSAATRSHWGHFRLISLGSAMHSFGRVTGYPEVIPKKHVLSGQATIFPRSREQNAYPA